MQNMRQSSPLSFMDMLSDSYNFMSMSTGTLSVPLTPHIDAALAIVPPQPYLGLSHATGTPALLAGTDSPAYMRLQQMYQQREAQTRQIMRDYDRLK